MNRMSYTRFLELLRRDAPCYEELARSEAIRPRWDADKLQVDIYSDLLSSVTRQWFVAQEIATAQDGMDAWLRAQVVAYGPKVFQPNLEQCLAMEQIAPNISLTDYAQPYPVMIVDLPEGYRSMRACPARSGGGETCAPECVLIGFHPAPVPTIWVDVLYSSAEIMRNAILPNDATIEAGLVREFGDESYIPADASDVPDRLIAAGVLRLAVNAMLLLAEFGCKRLGPLNKSHHDRLLRHADLARKKGRGVDEARRQVRLAPQLFGFAHDIVLYDQVAESDHASHSESALRRRPHWRRGHWKMHAHGPGRSLRKRIFIPPRLVNRHLLQYQESTGNVVYHVR